LILLEKKFGDPNFYLAESWDIRALKPKKFGNAFLEPFRLFLEIGRAGSKRFFFAK